MLSTTRLLSAGALLALAFSAAAQTPSRFIGLTAATPLLLSQDLATCAPAVCIPPGFPATTLRCAGGTAYDTRTRGTWITNGFVIAKVDSRSGCAYQCPPAPIPFPFAGAIATGLAYDHRANELYVSDQTNRIHRFAIAAAGCGLGWIMACPAPVPAPFTITGLAIDDVNARLLYCASDCTTPAPPPGGLLSFAPLPTPCAPTCTVPVQFCPTGVVLGPLTGLAYEACRGAAWVTDGFTTVAVSVSTACVPTVMACCANPAAEPYVGLCIEPSTEASLGAPCSAPSCPACAPLHFFGSGDPVLGNLGFTLDGRNLPANTNAATFLNFGACAAPGFLLPPFCAPLLVPLSATLLSIAQPTGGIGGCTGTTSVNASIPAVSAMCGLVLSSQVLGVCFSATGPVGTYVSNCLTWMITAS